METFPPIIVFFVLFFFFFFAGFTEHWCSLTPGPRYTPPRVGRAGRGRGFQNAQAEGRQEHQQAKITTYKSTVKRNAGE